MAGWRAALETLFGPLSPQALASQTFGLYAGFVYFTPILGGIIADRWLGARRTVIIGTLLMSAGHFAMAFDRSFLVALLLLVLGSGCLKGNIAAQVGHLYPVDDVTRRTSAFTIFSTAINFGAVVGPLACGLLAQLYGWHAGFGAAGGLMLLATIIYLAGGRHLPDQRPRRRDRAPLPPLTGPERRRVVLLVMVAAITIFQSVAYYQIYNVGLVWVSAHADLATPVGAIPVPWFNSIDAFFSIISVPPLIWLWARQARRRARAGRRRQDRDRRRNRGRFGRTIGGGGDDGRRRPGERAGAVPGFCRHGNRVPLLLAALARVGFPRRSRQRQRDHGQRRLSDPVRRQYPDGLGRLLVREDVAGRLLEPRRRHRRHRRHARSHLRPEAYPGAFDLLKSALGGNGPSQSAMAIRSNASGFGRQIPS